MKRYSEEVKSILEAAQQQAVINYNQELTMRPSVSCAGRK